MTKKYLEFDQNGLNNWKLAAKRLFWRECIDKLCFDGRSKQLIVHSKLVLCKMNFNIDSIESITVFNFIDYVTHCLAIDGKNFIAINLKIIFSLAFRSSPSPDGPKITSAQDKS